MTPMPPIAAAMPAQEPRAVDATQTSAFQPDRGTSLFADPSAIGRSILASLESFQVQAAGMQSAAQAARAGGATPAAAAGPAGLPDSAPAAGPADSVARAGTQGFNARQQSAIGVMLETFDFAMQTEMVTRAATTFTSSVNTLIKAQ